MRVCVKVLSPVHIGNGEKISGLEFLVENGRLKVYKFDRIISAIENIPDLQQKNNIYSQFKEGKVHSLEEILRNFNLNLEPNYELEINAGFRAFHVEEFIKTFEGPYIPGSELKGSIRHLIACAWFMNKPNSVIEGVEQLLQLSQLLKNRKSEYQRKQDEIEDKLEKLVFYPENETNAQFDVLKVLSIPDSQPLPYQSLRVEVPRLECSGRTLYPCEALKEDVEFEMEININKNAYEGLKSVGKLPEIGKYFSDENIFWNFLADCSRKFYSKLLDEEIRFFENCQRYTTADHLRDLKEYLNSGRVLLRLGKHEGILSTTLLLIVKENRANLFDQFFRKIYKVRGQTNKTRRVNSQGLTFGWLLLERL
jgi:CRISPR-associated protein Csm5